MNQENELVTINNALFQLGKLEFQNMNVSIPSGYMIGLCGKNGSGKSTFLRLLLGRYHNYSGNIQINGHELKENPVSALQQIGYLSENNEFFLAYTPIQNEAFYQQWYPNWDAALYRKLLEQLDLSIYAPLSTLSKGGYMKFQLAFALAHHPQLLLLDEPTAGLDPVFRKEFLKMLQDVICKENCSIILATHLEQDLTKIADYILEINGNNISWSEVDTACGIN